MLPLTKSQNWKPAPVRSLGQVQLESYTRDLSNSERLEQALLNTGLGLGVGALLGSVLNSFTAKPSVLAASIITGLGAVMSFYSLTLMSGLSYARTIQFGSGLVAGAGGMQVLKATSKTA